ncbi:hypothetical protein LIA77_04080 [Sarocladium implicatum]|nr:hypothetical protein LIA77_04080 [Sarocladium implicatum]
MADTGSFPGDPASSMDIYVSAAIHFASVLSRHTRLVADCRHGLCRALSLHLKIAKVRDTNRSAGCPRSESRPVSRCINVSVPHPLRETSVDLPRPGLTGPQDSVNSGDTLIQYPDTQRGQTLILRMEPSDLQQSQNPIESRPIGVLYSDPKEC